MKSPELLLPAGSLEKMRAAYDFGADAVYAGQPRYSLRARNNEFRLEQLEIGINEAKARGKKFFVTSNIMPHNDKVRTFMRDLTPVLEMKPDAVIMADPGIIMMTLDAMEKGQVPYVPIHLSVQANTMNYASVKFWKKVGIDRIILSRELSLDEIEKIRQECPEMELEIFVHGALCIAYSGRCLLSGYFNHRDPNQGVCTNACRWNYKTEEAVVDPNTGEPIAQNMEADFDFNTAKDNAEKSFSSCGSIERHPKADQVYLIEEVGRPGQKMPIMEDEYGTYIMNSKDLRAVEYIERICKIGVDSVKLEGRTKSLYYVSRAAQIYRKAIDDAVAGRPFNPLLISELDSLANRGYTSGFLDRHPSNAYQNYERGHSEIGYSHFVGEVKKVENGWAEVEVKNKFQVGDKLEIIHPSGNHIEALTQMTKLDGENIAVAPGSSITVRIPLDEKYKGALIARVMESQPVNVV